MDGTLLDSKKEIPKDNIEAIERALNEGKEVVLCTGRCIAELEPYIKQIPGLRYIVGVSGAVVYDVANQKNIYLKEIEHKKVGEILEISREADAMPHLLEKDSIVEEADFKNMKHFDMEQYIPLFEQCAKKVPDVRKYYYDNKMPIAKINLYHSTPQGREATKEKLKGMDVEIADAERTSVEISEKGTTKGTGLMELCKHLGISMEQVIAVGDADNDIDVLSKAGLSIAMGNANNHVKEICDVVVSDCNHGGCVEAIDKYLLG